MKIITEVVAVAAGLSIIARNIAEIVKIRRERKRDE